MMLSYWLRAAAVTFASFALFDLVLSALSSLAWIGIGDRKPRSSSFLFALLAAPLLLAAGIAAFMVLPAFLLFEPVAGDERVSLALLAFAAIGIAIVAVGTTRALTAWTQTTKTIERWSVNAIASQSTQDLPIITIEPSSPAVVVAGLARPKLLISRHTTEALTANELRLVVAHEVEHVRRHDNLRKLLLTMNIMPFRREIEEEWVLSSELAADRAAVASGADACDLAAALVKVSRLASAQTPLATNFAAATPSMLETRVQQLIRWEPARHSRRNYIVMSLSLAAAATILIANSASILSFVHTISELWMN
jgi:beta-lactamase regulating signal transducer with metallopeptidase domain